MKKILFKFVFIKLVLKRGNSHKTSVVGTYETWSVTLREECKLRIFENRILRGIFGSKRDENVEWKKLHSEERHSFYRSQYIVRVNKTGRLRWAGNVARIEEGRRTYKILTGKPTIEF